ncbi:nucleotidyltransferase family protein [Herbaspirillum lusitanum]|uniref:nucleotidyltransferase family protein n=1 Tax=Herbaspirillum lusitanum TaxID=213312 RepID=UPI00035FFAE0|nr:nucleotidyltransferase family protein [Herbaspirillum lusitanum]
MDLMNTARELDLPDWFIGAGAIRNTVWNRLHGFPSVVSCSDVDLIYFSSGNEQSKSDEALQESLNRMAPSVYWEVTNQALVHRWYEQEFGLQILPLTSSEDGVGTWPETATAVGVRLEYDGRLTVAAPCGLTDLFELNLRWNPRQASRGMFLQHLEDKQFLSRWPLLKLMEI